jgi:hypothetical protein
MAIAIRPGVIRPIDLASANDLVKASDNVLVSHDQRKL